MSKQNTFRLLFFFLFILSTYSRTFPTGTDKDTLKTFKRTLDSAKIHSPVNGSLSGIFRYTISPQCSVNAVDLWVRHSNRQIDTLKSHINKAPYSITVNLDSLSDHDQTNLQFGYTLFHTNGDTIVSSPTPHRWIINRVQHRSTSELICEEVRDTSEITVDGDLSEWAEFKKNAFTEDSYFKIVWSSSDLYLAFHVVDSHITTNDFVEVALDLKEERSDFFSIEQRILSYSPKTRSFCWAIDLDKKGIMLSDSVYFRFDDEGEWKRNVQSWGYTIEARIPFAILTSLSFPSPYGGFDAVLHDYTDSSKSDFYIWSNNTPFARYTPSEWGRIHFQQDYTPFKIFLFILLLFLIILLFGLIWHHVFHRVKQHSEEEKLIKPRSPAMQSIHESIEKHWKESDFTIKQVSAHCNIKENKIIQVLKEESNQTFDAYLLHFRVRAIKNFWETKSNLDKIVIQNGFSDLIDCDNSFRTVHHCGLKQWLINKENPIKLPFEKHTHSQQCTEILHKISRLFTISKMYKDSDLITDNLTKNQCHQILQEELNYSFADILSYYRIHSITHIIVKLLHESESPVDGFSCLSALQFSTEFTQLFGKSFNKWFQQYLLEQCEFFEEV